MNREIHSPHMPHLIAICLTIALCIGISTGAVAQMLQRNYAIISVTDASIPIPLREKPEPNTGIYYAYYHGTLVKVLNQENDNWWEVSIGGVKGFMEAAYLQVTDFADMTTELPVMRIKNDTDSGVLNLREKPSMQSDIIRQYTNDEQVLMMGISDDWYHVIGYGGRVGYMKPEFLEADGATGHYMFTEDLLQLRPRQK